MPRRLAVVAVLFVAAPAAADTFGGFSGVDRHYLVNQDRVCVPIKVTGGRASGMASCEQAATDTVAKLSIKAPIPQDGTKATFAAAALGRTLTVTSKRGGAALVTWSAPDSIRKVVEVYASQYDDRVAVAYTTRRAGKQVTSVIAFDLGQGAATIKDPTAANPTTIAPATPSTKPAAAKEDPKLTRAVAAARKASRARSLKAWKGVLALDGMHAEALYHVAAAQLAARQRADAFTTLAALAGSPRPDAIEWLIEARFDKAFATVRADPKFRSAVGLDRKASSPYERLMGFGGQWEQTGTSCDKPEIRFHTFRDRTFKLRVKTVCQGRAFNTPFKGRWRTEGDAIVLTLPNRGKQVTEADEAGCAFERVGDEDALRCQIGRDLEFKVLPTRR